MCVYEQPPFHFKSPLLTSTVHVHCIYVKPHPLSMYGYEQPPFHFKSPPAYKYSTMYNCIYVKPHPLSMYGYEQPRFHLQLSLVMQNRLGSVTSTVSGSALLLKMTELLKQTLSSTLKEGEENTILQRIIIYFHII